jgi:hypothetical protein
MRTNKISHLLIALICTIALSSLSFTSCNEEKDNSSTTGTVTGTGNASGIEFSLAGSYDTPGAARRVFISGNYAYIADFYGLQIINISNPHSPIFAGSYDSLLYNHNAKHKGKPMKLGDFHDIEPLNGIPTDYDGETPPWENCVAAYVYYNLPENIQNGA